MQSIKPIVATVALLAFPSPLAAHEGGAAAGLLSGLLHPVSGLDHVLAMLAVGIWGAQMGPPAIWVLPVTFPMVMAFGGMLSLLGVPVPGVEIGIGLSALLLGFMVAIERRPAIEVAAVLVGFFAIFHGYAHGAELPEGQSGILYSIGFVVSTGTLHASGIGVGLIHRWDRGKRALRIAGAGIAAGGAWFTWLAVSG
ncbi:MAG: HupE/UreJ family protein [Gemmatimonadetes bacterium]|nr:HupE/UreJ family protein [Gemmatimonadota bacterium]